MIIGIASDHRGIIKKQKLFNYLVKKGYEIKDYGTNTIESVDYPIYAFKVGKDVKKKKLDVGILICKTGIGMSIAANKVQGIRCAKVDNISEAKLARLHNNANMIALSNDQSILRMKDIIDIFLNTPFSNEKKHQRRIDMIDKYNDN